MRQLVSAAEVDQKLQGLSLTFGCSLDLWEVHGQASRLFNRVGGSWEGKGEEGERYQLGGVRGGMQVV